MKKLFKNLHLSSLLIILSIFTFAKDFNLKALSYKEKIEANEKEFQKWLHLDELVRAIEWDKDIEEITKLLDNDIDINGQIDEVTPLYAAVQNNRTDIVELLLKKKPDLEIQTYGHTPLTEAVDNNNFEITKKLIDAGANPNTIYGPPNRKYTLLMLAVDWRSLPIVNELLNAGASPYAIDSEGRTIYDFALSKGETEIADAIKAKLIKNYWHKNPFA